MTYTTFLESLDEDIRAEWVNGESLIMSPVSGEHQDIGLFLLTLMSYFVNIHRLGAIRYESFQMKTGPDLPGREPDIFFVANENLARLKKTYLDGPADLVVEIISPESRTRDRGDKYYEYEQGGVTEYWLIDPLRQQVEFYQRGPGGYYRPMVIGSEGRYQSAVLNGFWIDTDWLWQTPLPSLPEVLEAWATEQG